MIKELGSYKQKIISLLYDSELIKHSLLGNLYIGKTDEQVESMLASQIFNRLYIDGFVSEPKCYIFVETIIPRLHTNVKDCKVMIQVLCHKQIMNYSKSGYIGTRVDIVCEQIEEILIQNKINANKFGIGEIVLTGVDVMGDVNYYGRKLELTVPNFR